jgi:Arc/MetJ-type ribon-helix-helix transcriptional regulator
MTGAPGFRLTPPLRGQSVATTTMVSIRLPDGLVQALDAEVERDGVTRTEVVRQALEARLANEAKPELPTAQAERSDAELADELETAVRRRGAKPKQLARRDKAARLGISDAEARDLLARQPRGRL